MVKEWYQHNYKKKYQAVYTVELSFLMLFLLVLICNLIWMGFLLYDINYMYCEGETFLKNAVSSKIESTELAEQLQEQLTEGLFVIKPRVREDVGLFEQENIIIEFKCNLPSCFIWGRQGEMKLKISHYQPQEALRKITLIQSITAEEGE